MVMKRRKIELKKKKCFEAATWLQTKMTYSQASQILQILSSFGWEIEALEKKKNLSDIYHKPE